jgi:hypothetical protein
MARGKPRYHAPCNLTAVTNLDRHPEPLSMPQKNPGVRGSAPQHAVEQSTDPTTTMESKDDISPAITQKSHDYKFRITNGVSFGINSCT